MSEKTKKKPSKLRNWLIGISVVLLITLLGLIAYIYLAVMAFSALPAFEDVVTDLIGEEAVKFIEDYPMYLDIPPNAQDIYLHYMAWQDYNASIRFRDSPENIEAWIDENDFCFGELIPNRDLIGANIGKLYPWWTPNEGEIRAASEQCGNNPYYQISIDQSNPELWIVYLVKFSA